MRKGCQWFFFFKYLPRNKSSWILIHVKLQMFFYPKFSVNHVITNHSETFFNHNPQEAASWSNVIFWQYRLNRTSKRNTKLSQDTRVVRATSQKQKNNSFDRRTTRAVMVVWRIYFFLLHASSSPSKTLKPRLGTLVESAVYPFLLTGIVLTAERT